MSSGSYLQVYVKCPFYKFDDGKRRITCEGVVDECNLALIYQKKEEFLKQIQLFCCEYYTKCEVFRLLMDKYDDGDA